VGVHEELQRWWDEDAATYDNAPGHHPPTAAEHAAWRATMADLLPAPPARVLDCGAGTGFLSLLAARLGHRVTAVDLSSQMLRRLEEAARREVLTIETVEGRAEDVPAGRFDAVMERHLLWTLPDPAAALGAWRRAVRGGGRLVLVGVLADSDDPRERLAAWARQALRRLQGRPPDHHGEYPPSLRAALPSGPLFHPARYLELVGSSGWQGVELRRLRDVEWAMTLRLSGAERLCGVAPRFAVVAHRRDDEG
jgi:ubiquinone/menaquinone biosynthesis C-methylase UbiE